MILSFALCLFAQSQPFHWENDVDARYWQALHLLEVENKPAEALEALRGLVDESSVMQFRGQAGIILAQTYRAMLRNGQLKEAETLLPRIRSNVEGTEFKARAEQIVAQAQKQKAVQGEIDPEFLALVREQLVVPFEKRINVKAKAMAYGGRLSPYLRELIFNVNNDFIVSSNAFALSASLGDQTVLSAVLMEFQGMDSAAAIIVLQSMKRVMPFTPQAESTWANFLIELSGIERVRIAQRAIVPLVHLASSDLNALDRLDSILFDPESLLAPFALDELLRDPVHGPSKLLLKVIQEGDEGTSAQMRAACYQGVALDVLRVLAEGGDMDARRGVLWYLLTNGSGRYANTKVPDLIYVAGPQLHDLGGDVSWFRENLNPDFARSEHPNYSTEWQSFVQSSLAIEGFLHKRLALLVAMDNLDWDLALALLRQIPTPKNLAMMLPKEWPVTLISFLEKIVDQSDEGRLAAEKLMTGQFIFDPEVFQNVLRDEKMTRVSEWYISYLEGTEENMEYLALALDDSLILPMNGYEISERLLKGPFLHLDAVTRALSSNLIPSDGQVRILLNSVIKSREFFPDEALKNRGMSDKDVATMSRLLTLTFSSPWLEGRNRRNIIVQLKGLLDKLVEQDVDIAPVLFQFIQDPETRWQIAEQFAGVITRSPKLLRAILEKQPEMITPGNCRNFIGGNRSSGYILLEHPDPEVVSAALQRLAPIPNSQLGEFEESLLQCLNHPLKASDAARLVVRAGAQKDFIPNLIQAWAMPDLKRRSTLMSAIGSIYDERLLPVILEGIQYPEEAVLKSAEKALERYTALRKQKTTLQAWQRAGRDGGPADYLIEKLESKKKDVRIAAIESLGTIGAKEALPFLVGLLEDSDADVAEASAVALKKINAASSMGDKKDKD